MLPQGLRDGLLELPGELLLRRTADGLLLSPVTGHGSVRVAEDGLPVLELDRPVSNAEVLDALEAERQSR